MKNTLLTVFSTTLLIASTSQAAITLMNQSFTEDAGNQPTIDGTDVGSANTDAGVASTWASETLANGILRTDGHVFTLTGSAYVGLGSIVDDAAGTASGVFTLTTVMAAPTGTNWVSTGFFQSADVTQSFVDAGGLGTALYRTTGALDFFAGPGTNESGPDVTTGVSDPTTFITVLDVSSYNGTTDFGTVRFYTGSLSNLEKSYDFVLADGVDYTTMAVGISTQGGGGEGVIQSISLTQVPEPSTYAIWAGLATLGLVMLRRRVKE